MQIIEIEFCRNSKITLNRQTESKMEVLEQEVPLIPTIAKFNTLFKNKKSSESFIYNLPIKLIRMIRTRSFCIFLPAVKYWFWRKKLSKNTTNRPNI